MCFKLLRYRASERILDIPVVHFSVLNVRNSDIAWFNREGNITK